MPHQSEHEQATAKQCRTARIFVLSREFQGRCSGKYKTDDGVGPGVMKRVVL